MNYCPLQKNHKVSNISPKQQLKHYVDGVSLFHLIKNKKASKRVCRQWTHKDDTTLVLKIYTHK